MRNNIRSCEELSDDDFERIGEYFMGRIIGNTKRHAMLNGVNRDLIGQDDLKKMHVTMAKKLTECSPDEELDFR